MYNTYLHIRIIDSYARTQWKTQTVDNFHKFGSFLFLEELPIGSD